MSFYADVQKLGSRISAVADNLIAEKADQLLVLTQAMGDTIRGIGQHFTGLTTVQLNTNRTLRALRFTNLFDLVRYPIKVVQTVKLTLTGIKIGSISETVIRGTQVCLSAVATLNAILFVPFAAMPILELVTTSKVVLESSKILGQFAVGFGVILSTLSTFIDGLKVSKGLYLAFELQKAKTPEAKLEVYQSYLEMSDLDSVIEKSQSQSLIAVDKASDKFVTEEEKDVIRDKLSDELGEEYTAEHFWTAVDAVSKAHQKNDFALRISLGRAGRDLIQDLKSGKQTMKPEEAVAFLNHQLQRRLLRRSLLMIVSLLGLASTIMLLISAAPIPTLIATAIWTLSTAVNLYFTATSWLRSEKKEGDGAGYWTMLFATVVFLATVTAAFILTTTPAGYIGVALLCLLWLGVMGYTLYSIKHKQKKPDAFGRIT